MSIRARIIAIFVTLLALLGLIVACMGLSSSAYERAAEAESRRLESILLADQLRQSSDDLTGFARAYAATGDPVFETLFREVLAIRDGMAPRPVAYDRIYWDFVQADNARPRPMGEPVALVDLMRAVGISGPELAKLEEAKANSDALVALEDRAFAAVKGLYPDEFGNYTVEGEPNPGLALRLLYSPAYFEAKAGIMAPIAEFMEMVDARTRAELEAIRAEAGSWADLALGLSVLAAAFSLLAFLHLRNRVIRPVLVLADIAHRVEDGDLNRRARVATTDEVGRLNAAFNSMLDRTQKAIGGLRAEVDQRTRAEDGLRSKNAELEKAIADLNRAHDQLIVQERLASIGQLTAAITHEIKNPLTFVKSFSELSIELADELKEELDKRADALGEDGRAAVEEIMADLSGNLGKIGEHGRRVELIVTGMLDQSRQGSAQARETDVNRLVEEATKLAYHGMRASRMGFNVTFRNDLAEDLPPVTLVPQDMSRVVLNIVTNACHAVDDRRREEGGDYDPVIRIETRAVDGGVEIAIEDNGPGIPEDVRARIFEAFFTTKEAGKGTGLGLSICKEIVTEAGGTLAVDTEPGRTRFTVTLPLRPPETGAGV